MSVMMYSAVMYSSLLSIPYIIILFSLWFLSSGSFFFFNFTTTKNIPSSNRSKKLTNQGLQRINPLRNFHNRDEIFANKICTFDGQNFSNSTPVDSLLRQCSTIILIITHFLIIHGFRLRILKISQYQGDRYLRSNDMLSVFRFNCSILYIAQYSFHCFETFKKENSTSINKDKCLRLSRNKKD